MSFDVGYFNKKIAFFKGKKSLKPHQRLLLSFADLSVLSASDERDVKSILKIEKTLDATELALKKADDITRSHSQKKRKERNRKLVLYGLLVEKAIADGKKSEEDVISSLDDILIRKADRAIFGLAPLEEVKVDIIVESGI